MCVGKENKGRREGHAETNRERERAREREREREKERETPTFPCLVSAGLGAVGLDLVGVWLGLVLLSLGNYLPHSSFNQEWRQEESTLAR